MTTGPRSTLRLALLPRLAATLCCLLSITSGFNHSVLADVFDRLAPAPCQRGAVLETEEDLSEEEEDLFHRGARHQGSRGERKQLQPGAAVADDGSPSRSVVAFPLRLNPSRAGSEHALRNGLGAPLLC